MDLAEDQMATWQGREGHERYPEDAIYCPLTKGQLGVYFSLGHHGTEEQRGGLYKQQADAHHTYMLNPPLSKKRGADRSAKAAMSGLGHITISQRWRAMDCYIGFCVLFQHVGASFEHIMDPMLVAKYVGFLIAKGRAASSIKVYIGHLAETVAFVISHHCPGGLAFSPQHVAATQAWYTNLGGKLAGWVGARPKPDVQGKLWEAWEHAEAQWAAFKAAFLVCLAAPACTAWLARWHTHTWLAMLQGGGQVWTKQLVKECQLCVLRLLLVGLYQPPIRMGALRLLHRDGSDASCVHTDCRSVPLPWDEHQQHPHLSQPTHPPRACWLQGLWVCQEPWAIPGEQEGPPC